MLNGLIVNKSKEIVTLHDIINTNDLHDKSKRRKYIYIYYIYIYIYIYIYKKKKLLKVKLQAEVLSFERICSRDKVLITLKLKLTPCFLYQTYR